MTAEVHYRSRSTYVLRNTVAHIRKVQGHLIDPRIYFQTIIGAIEGLQWVQLRLGYVKVLCCEVRKWLLLNK